MDDNSCQVSMWPVKPAVCDDKKCQSTKYTRNPVCDGKNCQSTRCYKGMKSVNYEEGQIVPVCDDKNCQTTKFINIQSVTKPNNMWLPKTTIQSSYNKLCTDKNCQSTRCYKKKNQVCGDDKNCQSANPICYVKPEGTQSSYM